MGQKKTINPYFGNENGCDLDAHAKFHNLVVSCVIFFFFFQIQNNCYFCEKKNQIVADGLIASQSGRALSFKLYMHESFYKHNFKCQERKSN